jgi:hypothetical protein
LDHTSLLNYYRSGFSILKGNHGTLVAMSLIQDGRFELTNGSTIDLCSWSSLLNHYRGGFRNKGNTLLQQRCH